MARKPRNKRKTKSRALRDPESRGRAVKVRKRSGNRCTPKNEKPVSRIKEQGDVNGEKTQIYKA